MEHEERDWWAHPRLHVMLISGCYTSRTPITGWDLQNEDVKEERGRGE
jgi:hypothetical protein